MDPLTHAILGAAVSYAVSGRKFGRHAAALGALAGITPDIDHFVASDTDPLLYAEFHRSFTHAVGFSLVGVLLPMLPWLAQRRFRAQPLALWLCAWPAYLSHCLLDASTTWGTQLLWPFSRLRASWDIIAIVDPVFTLALLVLLIAALRRASVKLAWAGLLLGCAYLALGFLQHARAGSLQQQLAAARHHSPERRAVMPTLGNNLVWRSVYLADGKIHSDRIRVGWFSRGRVRAGTALPRVTEADLNPAERTANLERGAFRRFAWFSGGWLARAPGDASIIGDMRYSRSTEAFDPVWGIRLATPDGRPTVEWVSRERSRRMNVRELWEEVLGRDARYVAPEAAAKAGA